MTGFAKITPICRYGHGELNLVNAGTSEQFMAPVTGSMFGEVRHDMVVISPTAYSFSIYKCPSCSYLELHDPDSVEGA